jgi:hypothetical protein
MAWVLTHRTAAGIDEVVPQDLLDDPKKRIDECRIICRLLRDGRYRFFRGRMGVQRRKGKSNRIHAIATIRDAVVLRAISVELRAVWDELPRAIVGHRPGTNYVAVLAAISQFIVGGPGWVLRFDLKGAFASAAFDRAIKILARRTKRKDLIPLIQSWRATVGAKFAGLVEGSPVAPLLLAVLLADHVVPHLELAGGLLVIWGDDGLLMVRDRATVDAAYEQLVVDLDQIDLKCHPKKTGIHELDPTTAEPTPWPFIGFQFRLWQPIPCQAARIDLVERIENLVQRGDNESLKRVRHAIKGFGMYFTPGEPLDVFADLEGEITARCGFSRERFPNLLQILRRRAALRAPSGARAGKKSPGIPQGSSEGCWRQWLRRPRAPTRASTLTDSTTPTGPTRRSAYEAGGQGPSLLSRPPASSPPTGATS